jgi:hypothetical protein
MVVKYRRVVKLVVEEQLFAEGASARNCPNI